MRYDYKCTKCGKVFEISHSAKDTSPQKCPLCGSKMERVISKPEGLIFKGSGFHCNDYPKGRNYHG